MRRSFRSAVATDLPSRAAISSFVCPSIAQIATRRNSSLPRAWSSRSTSSARTTASAGSGSGDAASGAPGEESSAANPTVALPPPFLSRF